MILPRSPERRAAFLRSSWRDPQPEPVPLMLRPTTQELPAAETPRDCVVRYQLGPNTVLLTSYDQRGEIFEEFRTNAAGATELARTKLLERVRHHDATRLRLL